MGIFTNGHIYGYVEKNMKAIILAAGEGRRMQPFTLDTPKPLLKIQGKAIIDYVFDALPDEIDEVIITVKYLADKIKEYLGENYKGSRIFYVEGSENGNAIGFAACRPHFQEGERFLVMYGDEPQRRAEIEECLKHQYSWVCTSVPDPRVVGVAIIDAGHRILEVVEKPEYPKSNWSAMGTIVVDTNIFRYAPRLHRNGEYHFSSMLDQFVRDYTVRAVYGVRRPMLSSPADLEWDMKDFI